MGRRERERGEREGEKEKDEAPANRAVLVYWYHLVSQRWGLDGLKHLTVEPLGAPTAVLEVWMSCIQFL